MINALEYLENGALIHHPTRNAVQDSRRVLTFEELHHESARLGAHLSSLTTKLNSPIAVFLPKSANIVVANLSILMTGNFYTNIDSKSPSDRLNQLIKNVDPVLIITDNEHAPTLKSLGIAEASLVLIDKIELPELTVDQSQMLLDRRSRVIDSDPICLINTSGSTGVPKSVVLSHRGTIDFINWCLDTFVFDETDVIGNLSPLYFDIYTLELWVSLSTGALLKLIPDQISLFPKLLLEYLSAESVTFIFWVPTIMVTIANSGLLESSQLQLLKRVFFAGEVFPMRHLNIWRKKLPDTQFVNLYGPIEIHVDCTFFIVDRNFADTETLPIGIACKNSDVFLLDQQGQIPPNGEVGELCIRGTSLALGYYNDPAQTSRVFVQNPLNSKYPELIYRTGDNALVNSRGEYIFVGRNDYQIKHQGYRIELAEIETAVLALPEIRNSCALYSQTRKALVLIYEAERELTPAWIRSRLAKKLPKYMLPAEFVYVNSMPMNPNGKIDRHSLNSKFAS